MVLNMKHEVIRQIITILLCWVVSLLVWLIVAAISSTPLQDRDALFFFGTAELLMFYWITFLFAFIFLRETLEAYEPRWLYLLAGISTGAAKTAFYTAVIGQGISGLKTILTNPGLYMFAAQGLVGGICFVVGRPRKPRHHGFSVS